MNAIALGLQLEKYLALRRAIGYSSGADSRLWDFVRFVNVKKWTGPITARLAVDWSCSSLRCGPAGRARRLSLLRGFLSHVRLSFPDTEIPGARLIAAAPRPNPYIYSHTEIERFLEAARGLSPRGSLRPHTYTTLIGLLVSSGLRLSEAIRLAVIDVRLNVEPSLILVSQTKFSKSRIVPIHPTTAHMLGCYALQRESYGFERAFFVSQQGRPLDYMAVWRAFNTLRRRVGIQTTSDGRRPTVHALRHTFAVNRLLAWHQQGVDIKAWLPHLSVYMGHAEPKDTYWYLTATPDLLRIVADSFELHADQGGVK